MHRSRSPFVAVSLLAGLSTFVGCEPSAPPAVQPLVETSHAHYHVHSPDVAHDHVHADFPKGGHSHGHEHSRLETVGE